MARDLSLLSLKYGAPAGHQLNTLVAYIFCCKRAGLETLELTSDAVMTRDLSPLSLLQNLECLQVTSFNDPVSYAIHPAILTLPLSESCP